MGCVILHGCRGLRRLNLAGCGAITDRGLEVLLRLPRLESINLAWTPVSDAGTANLEACPNLEMVDLGGTSTGDGAIRALAGKAALREFRSGNGVTDAGLPGLHDLPVFKTWQGHEPGLAMLGFSPDSSFLMLRGSFTNSGLSQLVGLDGLFGLNVDSSELAITGAALAPLVDLPHLGWLAFDAKDESMPYIAALPHLRFLMCQDTAAGDDGFVALSRSRSIEVIWGRRCHNLQRRGFTALADMPSLRSLSVSCLNVDDEGVAALPRFPALRELMPMDVPDEGYRHIGRCERLESLVLMYCRDTGDRATGHLRGLAHLRKYFASYNRITDLYAGNPERSAIARGGRVRRMRRPDQRRHRGARRAATAAPAARVWHAAGDARCDCRVPRRRECAVFVVKRVPVLRDSPPHLRDEAEVPVTEPTRPYLLPRCLPALIQPHPSL